jgi:N-acetylmuramoyl-L-alanine amidase
MKEYDFPDIRDQLDEIKQSIDADGFTEDTLEELAKLENTITAFDSTRYPGNSYLLGYLREIDELIDSGTKINIPKVLAYYLLLPIATGLIVGELIWPFNEARMESQIIVVAAEQSQTPIEEVFEKLPSSDPAELDFSDEESQMLLKLAMAEAEDQGVTGKALVMNVVHNRVLSDEFPDTIQGVIFEENQFTPVSDGRYDAAVPDEECYEALRMVLNYWDASNGALFFEADWNENAWHRENLTRLFQYEDLIFYK